MTGRKVDSRQPQMMSEKRDELKRRIAEHNAKSVRLFDEAKQIQRLVFMLPLSERITSMNKVRALEKEAVEEARKSIDLEKSLGVE